MSAGEEKRSAAVSKAMAAVAKKREQAKANSVTLASRGITLPTLEEVAQRKVKCCDTRLVGRGDRER